MNPPVMAAPALYGIYLHVVDALGKAACDHRLKLSKIRTPASEAPVDLRCGRQGCASSWPQ